MVTDWEIQVRFPFFVTCFLSFAFCPQSSVAYKYNEPTLFAQATREKKRHKRIPNS